MLPSAMEEQHVVLFLSTISDVAVGIILATYGLCDCLPVVLGGLMTTELGEGFPVLFVNFVMQLLAVFSGLYKFILLLRGTFEKSRRLPVKSPICIGSRISHMEPGGNPDKAACQEQDEEGGCICCDHDILLPIWQQWRLPVPRLWWRILPQP